ncbi:hypothetical protein KA005_39935 [bacterium]|nr:hypothetical protein [bacterium]
MKQELTELKERLQVERQAIASRLKQIDDDLASIERVFNLVDRQKPQVNTSQLTLIEPEQRSKKFANMTFRDSIKIIFDENPGKFWAPKEIVKALLKEGFQTKSKDFGATVRTMLLLLRQKNQINATKTATGWLYGPTEEKGSVPHMDETEPNSDNGGLGERSKPTDL